MPINAVTDNAPYTGRGHTIFLKISLLIRAFVTANEFE